MIDPLEHDGKWIIVRNLRIRVSPGRGGLGSRTTMCFDGSWTGERWAAQVASAKTFGERQEAKHYLEKHLDLMA